jgi:hypothetical protein
MSLEKTLDSIALERQDMQTQMHDMPSPAFLITGTWLSQVHSFLPAVVSQQLLPLVAAVQAPSSLVHQPHQMLNPL